MTENDRLIHKFGISDVPKSIGDNDELKVKKYIKALEKFVENCPTPMSIALQGDWGTGKTTFLQSMQEDLQDHVTCIYFNTWQYSQFNMSGELYFSFLSNIVNKLSKNTSEIKVKDLKSKVMGFVRSTAKQVLQNKLNDSFGINVSEMFEDEHERASSIDKLKNDFEELIKVVVKEKGKTEGKNSDRVIIFVDDLDRLDPEIAVELLEVMKLFMDVKHCVYVLAIDYEVVVNGVKKKFGSTMSDDKCKSFFDKIIQLPFRMPVENYTISTLLSSMLEGINIKDFKDANTIGIIERMIKDTIGPNPRTLKRLVNSFTLLKIVNDEIGRDSGSDHYHTLLMLVLIVQMYDAKAYSSLIENSDSLDEYFNSKDDNEANGFDALVSLREAINKLAADNGGKTDNIYQTLQNVLTLSAMTNVAGAKEEVSNKNLSGIVLNGNERVFNGSNQTEAMKISFEMAFKYAEENGLSADDIDDMVKNISFLTYDRAAETSTVFRVGFELTVCGKTLFVGTAMGLPQKRSSIARIVKEINKRLDETKKLKPNSLVWKYADRDEAIC